MKRTMCAVLALAVASSTGCGVLVHGTLQGVTLTCSRHDAVLKLDGRPVPEGRVEVLRDDIHRVSAEVRGSGLDPKIVYLQHKISWWAVLGDIIFTGAIGCLVDEMTGGWYYFEPDATYLDLDTDASGAPVSASPRAPSSEQPASARKFCASCGHAVAKTGAAFCPDCGARQ